MPDGEDRYVTRTCFGSAHPAVEAALPEEAGLSLFLSPLDAAPVAASDTMHGHGWHESRGMRFDTFSVLTAAEGFARAHGGEVFERVLAVQGPWSAWNGYAVAALWEVEDSEREEAFCRSRRLLFEARRAHLRTFAFDWLLRQSRDRGAAARYLVLGLYGDEADVRQARSHPEVQRVAAAHPPASFGAVDLTGVRYFRVAAAGR